MADLLFLPSHAQRRRKNGGPQPGRFFLPNGSEIVGVKSYMVEGGAEVVTIDDGGVIGREVPIGRVTTLVLEFAEPFKVRTLTRRPTKKRT